MPKTKWICDSCGKVYEPSKSTKSSHKRRGSKYRFCSNSCVGAAKTAGLIGAKKKTGTKITCTVCGTKVYRQASRLREGRTYVCSEKCRLKAHEAKLIDRTAPRPYRLRGSKIKCAFCGTVVYRKKSLIDRRVHMTCGKRECVSSYSRSLWKLPPLTPEQKRLRKGPSRRTTNFTAAQRVDWLSDKCAWCEATENLCLDHIVPVAAGGKSIRANAQTLCQPCNIWKGTHIDRSLALALKQAQSGG